MYQVVSRESSMVRRGTKPGRPRAMDHELRAERNEERGATVRRAPCAFGVRTAITLTEVLISMGILTIGLLGVAALFPVGGFYMQKAEVADRGSAIAQSVMNEIVSRGMLNARAWYVVVPFTGTLYPSDGLYSPLNPPLTPGKIRATFTRPFALALGEALNQPSLLSIDDPTAIGKEFGSAYVIDPMGVAAMAFLGTPGQPQRNGSAAVFPAPMYNRFNSAFYPSTPDSPWYPWEGLWPVRRVTFRESSTGWHLSPTMAEHYCRVSDDLGYEFPKRDDRPAIQNWDTADIDRNNVREPMARQWTGDYSWIATVCPSTNAARDGMARNPEGHSYDVSVAVFYKRTLPPGAITVQESTGSLTEYYQAMSENERAVQAKVLSSGLNGGELLLEDMLDDPKKSPFDHLKSGNWIMLCGPHPNSTKSDPRFCLNWYQVISIEGRDTRLDEDGNETSSGSEPARRLVTLRGPQWPWTPGGNASGSLCVAICRGVVAVHTKTIRLEKNLSMRFGASGSATKTPPPFGPDA